MSARIAKQIASDLAECRADLAEALVTNGTQAEIADFKAEIAALQREISLLGYREEDFIVGF